MTGVFAGAAWHERETFEMFGIEFAGFDDGSGLGLRPLLLPDGFEGTPLRKSFQLAARASKPWPGGKEPGEGHESAKSPAAAACRHRACRPRVGAAMSLLEVTLRAASVLAAFLVLRCSSGRPSTRSWRTCRAGSARCTPAASTGGPSSSPTA